MNEMKGDPIHIELCEVPMHLIANEPGNAEYVFVQYTRCPVPTGLAAKRQAYVSTFTTSV